MLRFLFFTPPAHAWTEGQAGLRVPLRLVAERRTLSSTVCFNTPESQCLECSLCKLICRKYTWVIVGPGLWMKFSRSLSDNGKSFSITREIKSKPGCVKYSCDVQTEGWTGCRASDDGFRCQELFPSCIYPE